ncbi:MAG: TM2 domain-containing protein [Cellulosilyticum sp.]|nr:TM2 domain-containing protein [Cellulosilyticum sp.]
MYCKYCANEIDEDVIVCPKCGKQVQELRGATHQQTTSVNQSVNVSFDGFGQTGTEKNKITSIILCCIGFLGFAGLHKFYEGKIVMGILYILTIGFFGIGTIIDLIHLCGIKGETYYV